MWLWKWSKWSETALIQILYLGKSTQNKTTKTEQQQQKLPEFPSTTGPPKEAKMIFLKEIWCWNVPGLRNQGYVWRVKAEMAGCGEGKVLKAWQENRRDFSAPLWRLWQGNSFRKQWLHLGKLGTRHQSFPSCFDKESTAQAWWVRNRASFLPMDHDGLGWWNYPGRLW